jgi:hypothetical protein
MIAIAIIIPFIIVAIKVMLNYEDFINVRPINHSKEWRIMALCSLPAVVIFAIKSSLFLMPSEYLILKVLYTAAAFAIPGLMIAFFIWLFFDGPYNKVRGFNWWFTGSNDPDDARTDNFLQQLKLWQHIVIKIGGLALFVTLYILFK